MLEHEQISRSNRSVANMVLIQLRRLQTLSKRCIGRLLLFFFFLKNMAHWQFKRVFELTSRNTWSPFCVELLFVPLVRYVFDVFSMSQRNTC